MTFEKTSSVNWPRVAEYLAGLIDVEGDDGEVSKMTRRLADILDQRTGSKLKVQIFPRLLRRADVVPAEHRIADPAGGDRAADHVPHADPVAGLRLRVRDQVTGRRRSSVKRNFKVTSCEPHGVLFRS